MNLLSNKKILFIAPKFFGYEKEIIRKLTELGAEVDYFDERPENSFFMKTFIRLNLKKLINQKINHYYESILRQINSKTYDFVFFIVPETIRINHLKKLKQIQPSSKFILYMWDSIKNKKNVIDLIEYFDKIYTFDREDLNLFNNIEFMPLFYIDDYKKISSNNNYKYDLCFIGTAHSDRYKLLSKIQKQSMRIGLNTFYFLYLSNKRIFWFKKLFDSKFRKAKIDEFSFQPMNKDEILNIISKSKTVLDIQHPDQSGLTMRTIEMLGAKRKLITTNSNIRNYDFYRKNNTYIIDRKNPKLDKGFFQSNYEDLNKETYQKYSLENWLKTIFS